MSSLLKAMKQSNSSAPLLPPSSCVSLLDKSVSPKARETPNHSIVNNKPVTYTNNNNIVNNNNNKVVSTNDNNINGSNGNGNGMRTSMSMDHKMSDVMNDNNNGENKEDRRLYDDACQMLTHVYGSADERLPDQTKKLDYHEAEAARSSLLFGEVSPSGVDKIFDVNHLNAATAATIYDLGSGNGKLAMQAFLQYPNLKKVVGVEIAVTRAIRSFAAASRLAQYYPSRYSCDNYEMVGDKLRGMTVDRSNGDHLMRIRHSVVTEVVKPLSGSSSGIIRSTRALELRRQSLFDCHDALTADIIICETEICTTMYLPLAQFLSKMKANSRLLTYENIENMFSQCKLVFPFERLCAGDRYFTSWAPTNGHAFHLWRHI